MNVDADDRLIAVKFVPSEGDDAPEEEEQE